RRGQGIELAGGDGGVDDVGLGLGGPGAVGVAVAGVDQGSGEPECERDDEGTDGSLVAVHGGVPVGSDGASLVAIPLAGRTICTCTFVVHCSTCSPSRPPLDSPGSPPKPCARGSVATPPWSRIAMTRAGGCTTARW